MLYVVRGTEYQLVDPNSLTYVKISHNDVISRNLDGVFDANPMLGEDKGHKVAMCSLLQSTLHFSSELIKCREKERDETYKYVASDITSNQAIVIAKTTCRCELSKKLKRSQV